uniref:Uncharacterized protein n=1 Tax=Romanomermis culicivorax TaxID=13658 RepID=A0A915HFY9_ROMCU
MINVITVPDMRLRNYIHTDCCRKGRFVADTLNPQFRRQPVSGRFSASHLDAGHFGAKLFFVCAKIAASEMACAERP